MANRTLKFQETNLKGTIVNAAVSTTGLTIYAEFIDSKTGVARAPQSSTNLFIIEKDSANFEMILADSHSTTGGVTTIVVNSAGRNLNEYEEGVGSATGIGHPVGAEIGCVEVQAPLGTINRILDGTNSTTGTNFRIGAATDVDITLYAENADASKPFLRYDADANTTGAWVVSHDGTSTIIIDGAGGTFSAGNGIDITAGVVSVDIVTDYGLQYSTGNLSLELKTDSGLEADANGLAVDLATDPGLEFSTGLRVKVKTAGGITRDSDGLSLTTAFLPTSTYTAYEAITAGDQVCLKPIEIEYFSQLTDVNLALGNANARRKYAIKIIPSATTSSLTTMQFRAAEAVNGATALGDLTISIQTDNAGAPSGTAVSNGTANAITQVTQRTWNTTKANRTATWASPPTLTAGTTYWLVFEVAATDAANFLNLGENSTYDENYLTFTRLTFDLDAGTWGNSATNATPFFWFNNQPTLLGMALCQTDANFGGRTWPHIGSAVSNIAANASGLVYTGDQSGLANLTPGLPYYLSSTPGALTSTKPNPLFGQDYAYQIGIADSSTTLKKQLGEKMVWSNAAPSGSATTTHQLITWFKPSFMDVTGGYLSTANILDTTRGYFDGTNNYATGNRITNGAAPATSINTDASFGGDDFGGAYWKGVAASVTNIGLTYTVTKTSTPGDYNLLWKIVGK